LVTRTKNLAIANRSSSAQHHRTVLPVKCNSRNKCSIWPL